MEEELRGSLVSYTRAKFRTCPNVALLAEDIVQQAYVNLTASRLYSPEKENFGYLSVICLRLGYRLFMRQAKEQEELTFESTGLTLIAEGDITEELDRAEDAASVLESLKTLRDIERIVVTQRYYGDFSFAEIAERNGLKLNTVLSHHRRALQKLRPVLTKLLGYGREQRYEQDTLETGPHRRTAAEYGGTDSYTGRST